MKTLVSLSLAHLILECFAGVWPIYKHLAHINLYTAGMIAAVSSFSASLLQPLFGVWADRGYARGMVLLGTASTLLMVLLGPVAGYSEALGPVWMVVILTAITVPVRLGHSMFHPAGAVLAADALAQRRSAGLGIFIATGWVGYGLSQIVFSAAYLHCDGHTELLLIPGFLLLLWATSWCRPPQHVSREHQSFTAQLQKIWEVRREVGLLYIMLCLISMTNMALSFMFPELLVSMGYSGWVVNGGALAFLMGGTALGVVIGGYMADRFGAWRTLLVSLGIAFIVFQLFLMLPQLPTAGFSIVCVIAGILTGACQPLPMSMAQLIVPRNASMISGIMMGWSWAAASIAPPIVAYLAGVPGLGITGALSIIGLLNLGAVGCALALPRRQVATISE